MPHLDEALIRRFIALEATQPENRDVVLHLLRGCPECAARVRRLWRPKVAAEDYDGLLERVTLPRPKRLAVG